MFNPLKLIILRYSIRKIRTVIIINNYNLADCMPDSVSVPWMYVSSSGLSNSRMVAVETKSLKFILLSIQKL